MCGETKEQSQLIIIDSTERTTGTSSDFQVSMTIPIQASRFELVAACIPNTLYNVTPYNNKIAVDAGGGTVTTAIALGAYTPATLKIAVEDALNTLTALTWTFTYDSLTFFVTLAANGNFSLKFAGLQNSIASILGFAAVDTTSAMTTTGTRALDLIATRLYISIPDLGNPVRSVVDRATFVIPINAVSAEVIEYDSGVNFKQVVTVPKGNVMRTFQVRLLLPGFIPADLNGSEWSMTLRVSG